MYAASNLYLYLLAMSVGFLTFWVLHVPCCAQYHISARGAMWRHLAHHQVLLYNFRFGVASNQRRTKKSSRFETHELCDVGIGWGIFKVCRSSVRSTVGVIAVMYKESRPSKAEVQGKIMRLVCPSCPLQC